MSKFCQILIGTFRQIFAIIEKVKVTFSQIQCITVFLCSLCYRFSANFSGKESKNIAMQLLRTLKFFVIKQSFLPGIKNSLLTDNFPILLFRTAETILVSSMYGTAPFIHIASTCLLSTSVLVLINSSLCTSKIQIATKLIYAYKTFLIASQE